MACWVSCLAKVAGLDTRADNDSTNTSTWAFMIESNEQHNIIQSHDSVLHD